MKIRNLYILHILAISLMLFAALAALPLDAQSQTSETVARQFIANGPDPFFSHGRAGSFTLLRTQSANVSANLYEARIGRQCFALTEFAWAGGNEAQLQIQPARCSFSRTRLRPLSLNNFARQLLDHYVEHSVTAGQGFSFEPLNSSSASAAGTVSGIIVAGPSAYTLVEFTDASHGFYSLFVGKIQ